MLNWRRLLVSYKVQDMRVGASHLGAAKKDRIEDMMKLWHVLWISGSSWSGSFNLDHVGSLLFHTWCWWDPIWSLLWVCPRHRSNESASFALHVESVCKGHLHQPLECRYDGKSQATTIYTPYLYFRRNAGGIYSIWSVWEHWKIYKSNRRSSFKKG